MYDVVTAVEVELNHDRIRPEDAVPRCADAFLLAAAEESELESPVVRAVDLRECTRVVATQDKNSGTCFGDGERVCGPMSVRRDSHTGWDAQETSPKSHALGNGRQFTLSQCVLSVHDASSSRVRVSNVKVSKKSPSAKVVQLLPATENFGKDLHSIKKRPSQPKRWPIFGSASSHSWVHSLEPSLQRPFHSLLPQGFRTFTNFLPGQD
jgi:hypothetical protein